MERMTAMQIDRRGFVAGAAALGATAALPLRAAAATSGDATAMALLDRHAEALLTTYPEQAAFLGIDTGKRAALKSMLSDHSIAGEARRKADAARRLSELRAIDLTHLSPTVTTHVETATVAHEIALDGWRRMPVGDMAFLSANGYRSTPYVVSQGNGAFVDVPDLLENKHQIATSADAEAYLARMRAYAKELRDETERVKADAAKGVYLPGFLNDITARQLRDGAAKPAEWSIVTGIGAKLRAAALPDEWSARAPASRSRRSPPPSPRRPTPSSRSVRKRQTSPACGGCPMRRISMAGWSRPAPPRNARQKKFTPPASINARRWRRRWTRCCARRA